MFLRNLDTDIILRGIITQRLSFHISNMLMFSWHVLLVALCFWNLLTDLPEAVPAVAKRGPIALLVACP